MRHPCPRLLRPCSPLLRWKSPPLQQGSLLPTIRRRCSLPIVVAASTTSGHSSKHYCSVPCPLLLCSVPTTAPTAPLNSSVPPPAEQLATLSADCPSRPSVCISLKLCCCRGSEAGKGGLCFGVACSLGLAQGDIFVSNIG